MMVSVIMITYNHELYIKQAIEGVLMQQTTFDFELVIANDYSSDNTDNILREIIENNSQSERIKYIEQKKNIGIQPNYLSAKSKSKGKYIAICEGDDFWTDPLKLQKQVDFLEQNENYVLSCTNAKKIDNRGEFNNDKLFNHSDGDITIKDFLNISNPIVNCTVVYRSDCLTDLEFIKNYTYGDWALYSHLLATSSVNKARFFKESMARYRIYESGVFGRLGKLEKLKNKKKNFILFKKSFPQYRVCSNKVITELNNQIIVFQLKNRNKLDGFVVYLKGNNTISLKTIFYLLLKN